MGGGEGQHKLRRRRKREGKAGVRELERGARSAFTYKSTFYKEDS